MSQRTMLLYGHLRTRILQFDPSGTDNTVQSLLAGGLHTHSAPDNANGPFGYLLLNGRRKAGLDDADLEEEGQLEVTYVVRNRAQLGVIEDAMDITEGALLNYLTDQVGWLAVRELLRRHTMPAQSPPQNAELMQVRGIWRYTWWPVYRTQYATSAGSPAPST